MNGLFRLLCYLLAASALVKVFFGVFFHSQLYAFARRHYAADRPTPAVVALFGYALAMLIAVWYATLFAYQPYGYILTIFITLASVKTIGLIFNWSATSQAFVEFIDEAGPRLWLVDVFVAALGLGLFLLGHFLY